MVAAMFLGSSLPLGALTLAHTHTHNETHNRAIPTQNTLKRARKTTFEGGAQRENRYSPGTAAAVARI